MNTLKITLLAKQAVCLPLAYNYLIQSALYADWRAVYPDLHGTGYMDGGRHFRLFTFGPLTGSSHVEDKTIVFQGLVHLEVRSPVAELMEILADALIQRGTLRIGRYNLPVAGLDASDALLFRSAATIDMLSPLTIHETLPDGHTRYYAPTEEAFPLLLTQNLESKLRAAELPLPSHFGCGLIGTAKKRVTTVKGNYVTGYMGRFRLETNPQTMAFLYYTGLGTRNSQGFGMFSMLMD
ncbi:MAG: CRISPR-associated endoribonuclease Cas6 [Oscillibacter sp.]|nr:CRISPR-associated endoribonuclease Cas6 [Oscillibacter sp.]